MISMLVPLMKGQSQLAWAAEPALEGIGDQCNVEKRKRDGVFSGLGMAWKQATFMRSKP